MTNATKLLIAAVVAVLAIGGIVIATRHAGPRQVAVHASTPAAPKAVNAPAAPADCVLPAPAPPQPDGATATLEQMHAAHEAIQGFVLKLEAYQTCRNTQLDHAPPGTTDEQKNALIDQGNAAVDQAHALADAYSVQIAAFKAKHPGQ